MSDASESPLRVGVLFSARTDLLSALSELAQSDPAVGLVAAASDREPIEAVPAFSGPLRAFPERWYGDRITRDLAIAEWFRSQGVGLVVTAGWLWLLTSEFLVFFPNRVVNVHPTLLPAFPGRHSVEAAVAYGVKVHGVTVHLVDEGIDTGPILAQAAYHVPEPRTATAVRAALAPLERQLLRDVVHAFAHRRVGFDSTRDRWTIAGAP